MYLNKIVENCKKKKLRVSFCIRRFRDILINKIA